MQTDNPLRPSTPIAATLAFCAVLLCAATSAQAAWLDTLLGQSSSRSESAPASTNQRQWRIREFTTIELVPRPPGAGENQQPVTVHAEALRQQLALVQTTVQGNAQPLFSADELADLAAPLAQALGRAGPADDILLLSSSRREGGILAAPTAATVRAFVQGGGLQLIVHDTRYEYFDDYRGTNAAPHFTYGSRESASAAVVQSSGASARRADWLSIPLGSLSGVAPAATAPAPVAPAAAAFAPVSATAASPTAAPLVRKALDSAGAEDLERRLETLKRLRDKRLISEDEYQQKRKEILQLL